MRSHWPVQELGEIVSIGSGGTPAKSNASFWGGGRPWISAKDLKQRLLRDSIDTLTDEGARNGGTVGPGTLLILVRGMTLFKRVPIGLVARDLSFNQDIKSLAPNSSVDPEFLYWALSALEPYLRRNVDSAGHGTGRLNTEALIACPVPIPPLPEQRRIAEILRTWDEAIEKTERLIEAREKRRNGLLADLQAGRFGLRATDASWVQSTISEVMTLMSRRVEWDEDATYRLITVKRACGGIVMRGDKKGREIKTKDMYEVRAGDFVISKRQVVHGAWAMAGQQFDGTHVSKEYACFQPNPKKLWMPFFDWLSRTQRLRHQALLCSYGVDIEKMVLDMDWLQESRVLIPESIAEQQRIAEVLDCAESEIKLFHRERAALDKQKRGLMQKLLTGEWRVGVAESGMAAKKRAAR